MPSIVKRVFMSMFAAVLGAGCAAPGEPVPVAPVVAAGPAEPLAAQSPPAAPDVPASPEPPAPPELRLPDHVVPLAYRVDLAIDTAQDEFSGVIDIDINVLEPIDHLWLHAADIDIHSAELRARGQRLPAVRLAAESDEFVGLGLSAVFPAGNATLHIEYTAKISRKDYSGIFKQNEGERWYAYSQFEATSARRAFPCFDEPRFKVPWQLTVHVREGDLAFSNTPLIEETPGPRPGWRTFRFARTKPLPSYLVALAVGPFDIVDLGGLGRNRTPARILVPRGRSGEARYAKQVTGELVAVLEEYFDMPYPYAKLDSVVLPHFLGAMENPGLITYNAGIILAPPDRETLQFRRAYASVAAHEIAHQWFGDLVTLEWWNDTWLNESFATWMAGKTLSRWKPEWQSDVHRVARTAGAMAADVLITARRIRQPIESHHDIANAFDGITYQKGHAVLTMFERWIGEDRFRDGVRAYIKKHAWGTATAGDFLEALSHAGQPGVAGAFHTFLDQPGVPLLGIELACKKGEKPAVTLRQERLLPIGSRGSRAQTWKLPVCIKYGRGKQHAERCTLLAEATTTLPLELPGGDACPDWIMGNAGAAGYYRVAYSAELLEKLLPVAHKHLSVAERVNLFGDMNALVSSGALPLPHILSQIDLLLKDSNPQVTSRVADMVAALPPHVVPEALRPNYQRFVQKRFAARARKLGWTSKKTDSDDTRMLRMSMLALVAGDAAEPRLVREAVKMTTAWLDGRRDIDPEILDLVLGTAMQHGGDDSLHARLTRALDTTRPATERTAILRALAAATEPARIEKNMELVVSGKFRMRDISPLLQIPLANPRTQQQVFDYLRNHYQDITARLPRYAGAFLIHATSGFCDDAHHREIQEFFGPMVEKTPGGPTALKQTLEQIELCIAFRAAQQPGIEKFLQSY